MTWIVSPKPVISFSWVYCRDAWSAAVSSLCSRGWGPQSRRLEEAETENCVVFGILYGWVSRILTRFGGRGCWPVRRNCDTPAIEIPSSKLLGSLISTLSRYICSCLRWGTDTSGERMERFDFAEDWLKYCDLKETLARLCSKSLKLAQGNDGWISDNVGDNLHNRFAWSFFCMFLHIQLTRSVRFSLCHRPQTNPVAPKLFFTLEFEKIDFFAGH